MPNPSFRGQFETSHLKSFLWRASCFLWQSISCITILKSQLKGPTSCLKGISQPTCTMDPRIASRNQPIAAACPQIPACTMAQKQTHNWDDQRRPRLGGHIICHVDLWARGIHAVRSNNRLCCKTGPTIPGISRVIAVDILTPVLRGLAIVML